MKLNHNGMCIKWSHMTSNHDGATNWTMRLTISVGMLTNVVAIISCIGSYISKMIVSLGHRFIVLRSRGSSDQINAASNTAPAVTNNSTTRQYNGFSGVYAAAAYIAVVESIDCSFTSAHASSNHLTVCSRPLLAAAYSGATEPTRAQVAPLSTNNFVTSK